ncbi:hypothetical protein GCM10010435_06800 [Winogradskya consettensis]|uniref:Uncharacterized protein n=1 Tax=Winogradskya consettensis TaxID=113560 RepID=A0A919SQR8_9ACTN|nr:hypothetical protein [Actinoplanes consettensis]GIM75859.1 hypothetical protein Aco04nite_47440 [Actinoplanes consettensis]
MLLELSLLEPLELLSLLELSLLELLLPAESLPEVSVLLEPVLLESVLSVVVEESVLVEVLLLEVVAAWAATPAASVPAMPAATSAPVIAVVRRSALSRSIGSPPSLLTTQPMCGGNLSQPCGPAERFLWMLVRAFRAPWPW